MDENFAQQLAAAFAGAVGEGSRFKVRPFTGEGNENIKTFIAKYERFCEINERDVVYKTQNFKMHLDGKAFTLYDSLSDETKNNWERLKEVMEIFFAPTQLPAVQAYQKLNDLKIGLTESVQDFFYRFVQTTTDLALTEDHRIALFSAKMPKYIRDHLILQNPESLEDALKLSKIKEMVGTSEDESHLQELVEKLLDKIGDEKNNNVSTLYDPSDKHRNKRCFRCKALGHVQRNCTSKAKARPGKHRETVICYYCRKRGHIIRFCKAYHLDMAARTYSHNNSFTRGHQDGECQEYAHGSHSTAIRSSSSMALNVTLNSKNVPALVDTGSVLNAIDIKKVKQLKLRYSESSQKSVSCADGRKTRIFGVITVNLVINSKSFPARFNVMNLDCSSIILGRPFLDEYKAVINFSSNTLALTSFTDSNVIVQLEGQPVRDYTGMSKDSPSEESKLIENDSVNSQVVASLHFKQTFCNTQEFSKTEVIHEKDDSERSELPTKPVSLNPGEELQNFKNTDDCEGNITQNTGRTYIFDEVKRFFILVSIMIFMKGSGGVAGYQQSSTCKKNISVINEMICHDTQFSLSISTLPFFRWYHVTNTRIDWLKNKYELGSKLHVRLKK